MMSASPVFLWTDILIFILLATIAGFFWYVSRHEHLRAPWKRVLRSNIAVVSLVVLSVFV